MDNNILNSQEQIQQPEKVKSPAMVRMESLLKANTEFVSKHQKWEQEKMVNSEERAFGGAEIGPEPIRTGEETEAQKMVDRGSEVNNKFREAFNRQIDKKGGATVADLIKDVAGIEDETEKLYCAGELANDLAGRLLEITATDAVSLLETVPGSIEVAGPIKDELKRKLISEGALNHPDGIYKLTEVFIKNTENPEEREPFEVAKAEKVGYEDFMKWSRSIDMNPDNIKNMLSNAGVEADPQTIREKIIAAKLASGYESPWNLPVFLTDMAKGMDPIERSKLQAYAIGMIEANSNTMPDPNVDRQLFARREMAGAKALIGIFDQEKGGSYAQIMSKGEIPIGQTSEQVFRLVKKLHSVHQPRPDFEQVVRADHMDFIKAKDRKEAEATEKSRMEQAALEKVREDAQIVERKKTIDGYEGSEPLKGVMEKLLHQNPDLVGLYKETALAEIDTTGKDLPKETVDYAKLVASELTNYLVGRDQEVAVVTSQKVEGNKGFLGVGVTKDQMVTKLITHVEMIQTKIDALKNADSEKYDLQTRAKIEALNLVNSIGSRQYNRTIG